MKTGFFEYDSLLRRIIRRIVSIKWRRRIANSASSLSRPIIQALNIAVGILGYLNRIRMQLQSLIVHFYQVEWRMISWCEIRDSIHEFPNNLFEAGLKLKRSFESKKNLLGNLFRINATKFIFQIQRSLSQSGLGKNLLEYIFRYSLLRVFSLSPLSYVPIKGRILFVIGTLGAGGAERQLLHISKQLSLMGFDVQIGVSNLKTESHRQLLPEFERHALRIIDYGNQASDQGRSVVNEEYPLFKEARNLHKLIENTKPEIVHSWMDYCNCETLLVNANSSIPKVILGLRSISPNHFQLWSPAFRPIYRYFIRPNVRLVSNSVVGRESYAKWLGTRNIDVIPNCFDPTRLRNTRKQAGSKREIRVIGCMRLSNEKRPTLWVQTAVKVCKEKENVFFHLFGEGPLREPLQHLIEKEGMQNRIFLEGYNSNPWILRNWDIHLLTSKYEGNPNVVFEAAINGIPSISFNVGDLSEIFNHDEILILKRGNQRQLTKVLTKLINNKELRIKIGNNSKEKVLSDFSVEKTAQEYAQLYFRS